MKHPPLIFVIFCLLLSACNFPAPEATATPTLQPISSPAPTTTVIWGEGYLKIQEKEDLYKDLPGNQLGVVAHITIKIPDSATIATVPFSIKTKKGNVAMYAGVETLIPGFTKDDFYAPEISVNGIICTGGKAFICPPEVWEK